jgi:hypothetical protein
MANKKKTKKKSKGLKKSASRKGPAAATRLKSAARKKLAKKTTSSKKPAARKGISKKAKKAKTATSTKIAKTAPVSRQKVRNKNQGRRTPAFLDDTSSSRLGNQAGDLQGLSNVESADSESVDELVEEGNAFEAGIVSGVEDAGERGMREVRTREVPEDDVPGEYLDED